MVTTSAILPLLVPRLRKLGVLDTPSGRSSHTEVVPRGGGVALGIGVVVSMAATGMGSTPIYIATCAFCLLGFLDDVRSRGARIRLLVQAVIALVVFLIMSLQGDLAWLALVPATLFMVVVVNATNFMDGINGITAIHAVFWGGAYGWLSLVVGAPAMMALAAAMAGVGAAFIPWNFVRAFAFLGDAGAYLIGSVLVLLVVGLARPATMLAVLAPIAIYATDTAYTLWRRFRRGELLLEPHRDHVYQRIVASGWGHATTATLVVGFTAVNCIVGTWSVGRPFATQLAGASVVLATCLVYAALPNQQRLKRSASENVRR